MKNNLLSLIILSFLTILIIIINITACKTDPIIPEHDVCFATEVLPVFISNCTQSGCHDLATHNAGYILTDYEHILKGISAENPNSSEIYQTIRNGEHNHKNILDYYGTGIIKMWIEQGAKNDITCSPDYCDSLDVSYTKNIKLFFDQKCISCHFPANPDSTIDLTTFQQAHDYAIFEDNILMYRVTYNHKNINITKCERAKVRRWMETGAN